MQLRRYFKILLITTSLIVTFLLSIHTIRGQELSWTYPSYDVAININEDTTYIVKETATFEFSGELNGLRRDITLHNEEKNVFCAQNPSFSCGGFEFLQVLSVEVNGRELSEAEYSIYEVNEESSYNRYLRVEHRLYPSATYVVNEIHTWTITYKVFGGIQELENSADNLAPYFYWNVLPEDRGGRAESSEIIIQFPNSVMLDPEKHIVYYDGLYNFGENQVENALTFEFSNLRSFDPITISYEFNQDELIAPGNFNFNIDNPQLGVHVFIDDFLIPPAFGNEFNYYPVGEYDLTFERYGYETVSENLVVQSGEDTIINTSLEPTTWMQTLLIIEQMAFILGILGIGFAIYLVYRLVTTKGRDVGFIKTVVPQFSPLEKIKPYLMGSIIDERVDLRDITSTIIDLAYRGFIKIKEIKKGSNYELFRINKDKELELDAIEQDILNAFFGSKDSIKTSSLSSSFVTKIESAKNNIYSFMVSERYFARSPKFTRNLYLGLGFGSLIFGVFAAILGSIFISSLIGIYSFFTIGLAVVAYGIGLMITSNWMPAKTSKGSKLLNHVQGFKMYLHTAERYRLKDLTPDEFERYLSYAVAFGVEKQWADSFKDIYNKQPDWYEGGSITNAYLLSNLTRSFVNTTQASINKAISNAGQGSGWSGAGSFGGFSGGGGGGGSSGGW